MLWFYPLMCVQHCTKNSTNSSTPIHAHQQWYILCTLQSNEPESSACTCRSVNPSSVMTSNLSFVYFTNISVTNYRCALDITNTGSMGSVKHYLSWISLISLWMNNQSLRLDNTVGWPTYISAVDQGSWLTFTSIVWSRFSYNTSNR